MLVSRTGAGRSCVEPTHEARFRRPGREVVAANEASWRVGGKGDSRGDGEGIPRKGPRLVNVTFRRDPIHQVSASTVRCRRKTSADHFSKGREVWLDLVKALSAPAGDSKTGHHLIED